MTTSGVPRSGDPMHERLARLAALRPALERREVGVLERLHALAYADGWVRADLDWVAWSATAEARALLEDPAPASPAQVARLLTLVVRGERFDEGSLAARLETGWWTAFARRVDELAATVGRGTDH